MVIRKLEVSDAKDYQSIRLTALQENPEYYGSSYEEESKQNMDFFKDRFRQENTYIYGAFLNDNLIGIIVLVKESRIKTSHIANIHAMYVDPSYRRLGAAKSLIQIAIKQSKDLGVERIRLSVTKTNDPAYRLYESLGFIMYGVEPKAIKIQNCYYDMIHMNFYI